MAKFSTPQILEQLAGAPLVPLFFHPEVDRVAALIAACYHAGLRSFEFTNRGPEALGMFAQLRAYADQHHPDLALGVGTIYDVAAARHFVERGADFIVQPVTTPEVGNYCQQAGVTWIPGALTLNEIYQASQLGASIVKVFPGDAFGPEYLRAIRGPLPHQLLMVTGGILPELENLRTWLDAGANFLGLGSQLAKMAESKGYEGLTAHLRYLLAHLAPSSTDD